MNISDEAVEAAAVAIYQVNKPEGRDFEIGDYRPDARAALEAAAPLLRGSRTEPIPNRDGMSISDAAVEAAAKGFATALAGTPITYRAFLRDACVALEFAAPHLMAQAWDEGYDYCAGVGAGVWEGNPYRAAGVGNE
jgi:hypothetical protein